MPLVVPLVSLQLVVMQDYFHLEVDHELAGKVHHSWGRERERTEKGCGVCREEAS